MEKKKPKTLRDALGEVNLQEAYDQVSDAVVEIRLREVTKPVLILAALNGVIWLLYAVASAPEWMWGESDRPVMGWFQRIFRDPMFVIANFSQAILNFSLALFFLVLWRKQRR